MRYLHSRAICCGRGRPRRCSGGLADNRHRYLGLCLAFYYLNKLKPELKGGVYSYARAGFGSYVGFNSAWGYWLSELLSNISFLTLLFASVGQFLPLFGVGNNIPSVIGMSVVWWIAIILVLRGTKESTAVNLVSTIAKIIPILVLIVVIIFARAFSFETFMQNFSGSEGGMSFGKQVMATTTTTVWAFTGIEGAVVISGRAKRSSDVGRATVIGFLSVLILYIIISFLSAGVMTNEELAALGNPPMAGILEHVVGPWGAALVNIAVIISLLGATLGHTIMCTECPYEAAKSGAFCKAFTRTNKNGAPVFAIVLTSIIAQVFLVLLYFNESTYQVFYFFATGMIMVPYFLSAMYFCKVALKQENGDQRNWYFQRCLRGLDGLCRRHQRHAGNRPALCARYLCLCQGTKGKGTKSIRDKG